MRYEKLAPDGPVVSQLGFGASVAWIGEPPEEDLLGEIEAILVPVRDCGWVNGRPENQNPGQRS